MEYTVVIRTLGQAGDKYRKLLNSLLTQTVQPVAILVYIAEGYELPKETIGVEKYIFVKKGMVAQRALPYSEVKTPYVLFLDDDVYLPPTGVETLYNEMIEEKGDVISPCVFFNHQIPIKNKIRLTLLGREVCRLIGNRWSFKVLRNGAFSYNNNPTKAVLEAQSNAGPCLFCKKEDFLATHLEDEKWLDDAYYAFPEDQVLFYKMYCQGLKVLTSYDSGIMHLDASSTVANPEEKARKVVYSEYRNKLIFWHRFIFLPETNMLLKLWSVIALVYTFGIQFLKYIILKCMGKSILANAFMDGLQDAWSYLHSTEYKRKKRILKYEKK